jgi:hypothetical protein
MNKPPIGAAPSLGHPIYAGLETHVSTATSGRPSVLLFNEGAGKYASTLVGGRWVKNPFVGSVTWARGRFGRALQFGGGAYVDIGDDAASGDQRGTIIVWLKPASIGVAQSILSDYLDSNNIFHVKLGTAGTINVQALSSSINDSTSATTTTLVAGKWYQCAWTSNGGAWKMYVNGILQATTQASGSNSGLWFKWLTNLTGTVGDMRIGWDGTGFNQPFTGIIDHVRILGRQLPQSQIRELYARPFADFLLHARFVAAGSSPVANASRWFLMQ